MENWTTELTAKVCLETVKIQNLSFTELIKGNSVRYKGDATKLLENLNKDTDC